MQQPNQTEADIARLVGSVISRRRTKMGLSMRKLATLAGASLDSTVLTRIEKGERAVPRTAVRGLSAALGLPEQDLMNALGYTTPAQQYVSAGRLVEQADAPLPVTYTVSVMDNRGNKLDTKLVLVAEEGEYVVVNLGEGDPLDALSGGEAVVRLGAKPTDGTPVVVDIEGKLVGTRWPAPKGAKLLGTIVRLSREFTI